jgi:hypothetical protein
VGFVVDKVTLGQVFSEYFGFPCQSSLLMRELISVYSENHAKSVNTLCGQNAKIVTDKTPGE